MVPYSEFPIGLENLEKWEGISSWEKSEEITQNIGMLRENQTTVFSYFSNIEKKMYYRLGMVNLKSFISKVLLQIKWKFELTYALEFEFPPKLRIRNYFELKLWITTHFGLKLQIRTLFDLTLWITVRPTSN